MALADGVSRIRAGPLSLHTQTAIHISELLTGAKFSVQESPDEKGVFYIECQGIAFENKS
jgi:RNA 3'-terminal phosphate cyclase (ATP)